MVGKLVRTAIWKRSVPHRVMARATESGWRRSGGSQWPRGEQRAVMVYQIQTYRYWEKQLAIQGHLQTPACADD